MARRPSTRAATTGGSDNAPPFPSSIRLTAPHGFIETVHNKGVFHWEAGEVVTNPATIALLIERKANWEPVECLEVPASPQDH
ncbi:MAG: hypothetical protein ABF617_08255 [Gluconobacter japonicus]|uniref:hypothetical protein n=1 Tax=Gluconobacter japonicus TaxID=376620 RepID=UPI0039EA73F2